MIMRWCLGSAMINHTLFVENDAMTGPRIPSNPGRYPDTRLRRNRQDRWSRRLVAENRVAKGNVLEAARLAGIMAAKRTAELIPLCHPLSLTSMDLEFELAEDRIEVEAEARIRAVIP